MMRSKIMMSTIVNSWPLLKCLGTGDTTYIKLHIPSRSTPITQISCTGKILEITIEEWCAGMQNSWNTTSNWCIFQARRTDGPIRYLGAQIMTRAITITKDLWCYHPSFSARCTTNMSARRRRGPPCLTTKGNHRRSSLPQQESLEVKKRIQTTAPSGGVIRLESTLYCSIRSKIRSKETKKGSRDGPIPTN